MSLPPVLDPLALTLDKTCLIEASAGTGKTYTITTLVTRLVAQGCPIESILVVTFTEAAAAELKLRIRERLVRSEAMEDPEEILIPFFKETSDLTEIRRRLRSAISSFDQAAVMTIHAFCLSMLKDNAFESASFFDLELLMDSPGFLHQTVMDFFGARVSGLDPLFLSYLQGQGVTPKSFESLFKRVVSCPGIRVLPKDPGFTLVFDRYRETMASMAQVLATEADKMESCLATHPGLDKRSYSKRYLASWLAQTRQALTGPGVPIFDMSEKGDPVYKFTRTRLAQKTKSGFDLPAHPFFDLAEEILDLTGQMAQNLISLKHEFIGFFHEALAKFKQSRSACFFDDLINDLWAALEGPQGPDLEKAVTDRYRACLIDEFQDTDPVQYRIFSKLFKGKRPFFMIGDPKQAIYGFRGGDIFAYLDASRKADQSFTLGTNFRSDPSLVQAVNHLFTVREDPFGLIPFYPVTAQDKARDRAARSGKTLPPFEILALLPDDPSSPMTKVSAETLVPGLLAQDILAQLGGLEILDKETGCHLPVSPGQMAVLVRTNAQAQAVYQALGQQGIKAFVSKTGSVFDTPEALALFDLLSAVHEPDQMGGIKAALSGDLFGLDAGSLVLLDEDPALGEGWQERFRGYHRLWKDRGFVAMINQVLHPEDATPGLECTERALTNYYHLVELVSQAALNRSLSASGLLAWYQDQLDPKTREQTADELRLESDSEAVAIVTIHKSKGLEYPVVFLPFLWDAKASPPGATIFHDPDQGHELTVDLGNQERARAAMAAEDAAEQMRLLYVALTRASVLCRVYWAGAAGCEKSALGRLLLAQGELGDQAQDLNRLVQGSGQTMALVPPPQVSTARYCHPTADLNPLLPRPFHLAPAPRWRVTSYSGLAASLAQESGPGSREAHGGETDPSDPILLNSFPKGAAAGDCFHKILEDLDFLDPDQVQAVASASLSRYGFSQERYLTQTCEAVHQILGTTLTDDQGGAFSLNQIAGGQRFKELEFCYDIRTWNLEKLASLFEADPVTQSYGQRLTQMTSPGVNGFVKGFIDLVVCQKGRWYILDYKSNYLGSSYGDYQPKALFQAMVDHDYILQYHLYLLALDRYLALRLPGYDYAAHFGGVFYLFIRGMDKEKNTGVFFHRPLPEFLTRLKALV